MIANELRIGNWVNNHNSPYKIGKVTAEDFSQVDSDGLINRNPIPLTEEWLLKFGFEKNSNYYEKDFFLIESETFEIVLENAWAEHQTKKIAYVHELQNFYFAWEGKELELKKETV